MCLFVFVIESESKSEKESLPKVEVIFEAKSFGKTF